VEHETGWELFLEAAKDDLTKGAEKAVVGAVIGAVLPPIIKFLKERWKLFIQGGVEIVYAEIRTDKKGIKRINFAEFEYTQLACLLRHYREMTHMDQPLPSSGRTISDQCFEKKLCDPP
jgi:hypothetical protein